MLGVLPYNQNVRSLHNSLNHIKPNEEFLIMAKTIFCESLTKLA